MQIRALAKSRGVAGNATVTTATCKSILILATSDIHKNRNEDKYATNENQKF
jgi:hypothetical protein